MRQTSAARSRSPKHDRLEARITREQKNLITRAAALRGTSVTEFVVVSAQEAAAEAIRESEILMLRGEARDVFVRAILKPPAPNRTLRKAARRYRQQMAL